MQLEQYWKTQYIKNDERFPFLLIDNWYTPNEEKAIWKELDFYSSLPRDNIERAENSIVARYKDGKSLSKAFRHYPNEIFTRDGVKYSATQNTLYKFKSQEFHKMVDFCKPHSRSFQTSNADSTIISYYEDSDYYDPHHDTCQWTFLCWFFREPKKFDGGDLILNESNVKISLKHNRAVFFPSYYLHQVEPINFKEKNKEMGFGRYTITHFFWNKGWD